MADAVEAEPLATAAQVDELPWLHAHEYTPWGVQIAAAHDHRHAHAPVVHYGLANARAALINDAVAVVVGGRDLPSESVSFTSRMDLFDLQDSKWLNHYDIKGEMRRRQGHSIVSLGTEKQRCAVVFGGEALESIGHHATGVEYLSDCFELSFTGNILCCTPITPLDPLAAPDALPKERAWHSATPVTLVADSTKADATLVLGGVGTGGIYLSDAWTMALERTVDGVRAKWTPLTPSGNSPLPLAFHRAVAVNDGTQVVVVGGRRAARGVMVDTVAVLDIALNAWSQLPLNEPVPAGWTPRCCLSAVSITVPLDPTSRQIVQIKKSEAHEGEGPEGASHILLFGGFSTDSPVTDPTRFALLHTANGTLREVHAPNVGLTTYMGQATVASADAKSVFIFGGIDAKTRQFTDTVSAIHFWKPQPGAHDEEDESNQATNGVHTKSYENGDEYTGEMDPQRVMRHGNGRCMYHDGCVYDGEWMQDQRSGQGVMTYANGDTYAGQWLDDMRHGTGIYESQLRPMPVKRYEQRYDGQWAHDAKAGSGSVTYSDGAILKGTWENGAMVQHNVRLESYDDGTGLCTYVGDIVDGVPHGHGDSKHARESYTGNWLHGKRSGQGVLTLFDGTTYRGEWKNGKKNGFGVCEYARTKDKYDGKWVGGVRCGRGRCMYANGSEYDGEWKDDKCHGTGRYTFPDGTFYEGNWHANKFCGDGALVLDLDEPPSIE